MEKASGSVMPHGPLETVGNGSKYLGGRLKAEWQPRITKNLEWSPPQPATQHLCAKEQWDPLMHLSKLNFWQISCPVAVWVLLPLGVEDGPVIPVPVWPGWNLADRKGCLVAHHTKMSSLRWFQAISLDLSLAAACLNKESYFRQADAEYAENRWQIYGLGTLPTGEPPEDGTPGIYSRPQAAMRPGREPAFWQGPPTPPPPPSPKT